MSTTATLAPAATDPDRIEAFIPAASVQCHAANVMPLPNGDLACVWFGGTQEGIPDISVYFSRLPAGSNEWQPAEKLSDDPTRSEQNPILFPAPDGRLWLMWTAQLSGNQDTAIVRRRISTDNGHSWGPVETLFDVVGTSGVFVRHPPAVLDNGDLVLPIFYCHGRPGEKWVGSYDTSAVRISSDGGVTWTEVAVPGSTGCVHMNVQQLDGSRPQLVRTGGDGASQQQLLHPVHQTRQRPSGPGVQQHECGRRHRSPRLAV